MKDNVNPVPTDTAQVDHLRAVAIQWNNRRKEREATEAATRASAGRSKLVYPGVHEMVNKILGPKADEAVPERAEEPEIVTPEQPPVTSSVEAMPPVNSSAEVAAPAPEATPLPTPKRQLPEPEIIPPEKPSLTQTVVETAPPEETSDDWWEDYYRDAGYADEPDPSPDDWADGEPGPRSCRYCSHARRLHIHLQPSA